MVKRPIVVVAVAALTVVTGLIVWAVGRDGGDRGEAPATPSPSVSVSVSAEPSVSPSTSETAAPAEPSPTQAPPSKTAEPTIRGAAAVVTIATVDASGSKVTVGGFVAGIVEDGGSCVFTVTATDTGATNSVEAPGAANVDSTSCGSRDVALPASAGGEFSVMLKYTNAEGSVTSSLMAVEES